MDTVAMRLRRARSLGVMLLAMLPAPGVAQQVETCTLILDRASNFRRRDIGGGRLRQYASGAVRAHCRGQATRMEADSVAMYGDRNRVDFVGRVRFSDSTVTLDADHASYFLVDERLYASGSARLVNQRSGTILTGPNLTYWREVEGLRDTTELFANRRPTVEYFAAADTTDEREPYVIVGDQIRVRGEDEVWSGGQVTIDRSDFRSRSDSAELRLSVGEGHLFGSAHVEGGDSSAFAVDGVDIRFLFDDGQLRWVRSMANAVAESQEWRLTADTMEFDIADDLVQGGNAWGTEIRPRATSEAHTIDADSLAIDTPEQILTEIRGFGSARAVSIRDSVDTEPNWVMGDSLTARFDSASTGERMLVELDAVGNAHAFYRIFDPLFPDQLPDINYSRGRQILARLGEQGLRQVDVMGEADGVHLEPAERRGNP